MDSLHLFGQRYTLLLNPKEVIEKFLDSSHFIFLPNQVNFLFQNDLKIFPCFDSKTGVQTLTVLQAE